MDEIIVTYTDPTKLGVSQAIKRAYPDRKKPKDPFLDEMHALLARIPA